MPASMWLNAGMFSTIAFGLASLTSASPDFTAAWRFRMQTNLVKQPEAIAELRETSGSGAGITISCSVLDGPKTTFALGFRGFQSGSATSDGGEAKHMLAVTAGNRLDVETVLDPNEPLTWTYVATGAQAVAAAQALAATSNASIVSDRAKLDIAFTDADSAIQQVLDRCPFKG
jgi:hypothetical protein